MYFHKKLGVCEACKKVCKDFFDTLSGTKVPLPLKKQNGGIKWHTQILILKTRH